MDACQKIVKNKDVDLFSETFGKKEDTAVLLMIGAGAVSEFYPDFFCISLAEKGFFVIRYDQRDYGKSTHFDAVDLNLFENIEELEKNLPYTINAMVSDANMLLNYYGVKQAHIVGHSLGGIIGQLFAINNPDKTLTLTSISSRLASINVDLEPVSNKTLDILLDNNPEGDLEKDKDGWFKIFKHLNGDLDFDEKICFDYLKALYEKEGFPDVCWNHIAVQEFLPNYDKKLKSNEKDTLIIHGEKDVLQSINYANNLNKVFKNSELKEIENAGHMFFNKKAWDLILKYLEEHFNRNKLFNEQKK